MSFYTNIKIVKIFRGVWKTMKITNCMRKIRALKIFYDHNKTLRSIICHKTRSRSGFHDLKHFLIDLPKKHLDNINTSFISIDGSVNSSICLLCNQSNSSRGLISKMKMIVRVSMKWWGSQTIKGNGVSNLLLLVVDLSGGEGFLGQPLSRVLKGCSFSIILEQNNSMRYINI